MRPNWDIPMTDSRSPTPNKIAKPWNFPTYGKSLTVLTMRGFSESSPFCGMSFIATARSHKQEEVWRIRDPPRQNYPTVKYLARQELDQREGIFWSMPAFCVLDNIPRGSVNPLRPEHCQCLKYNQTEDYLHGTWHTKKYHTQLANDSR